MLEADLSRLENEWITLQNQYDSYEKCALLIKLTSVLVCSVLMFVVSAGIWLAFILAILWLQDGIWKTFQHRIGQRLDVVEMALQQSHSNSECDAVGVGMQFNLNWSQSRPNATGLIIEYVTQSLKPTVAYPHILLIAFVCVHTYVT